MPSEIQAVMFSKNDWNDEQAKRKLKSMGLHPIKPVHETANYLRYRIQDPGYYTRFAIKPTSKGMKLVIGFI